MKVFWQALTYKKPNLFPILYRTATISVGVIFVFNPLLLFKEVQSNDVIPALSVNLELNEQTEQSVFKSTEKTKHPFEPEMVQIAPGKFFMGSPKDELNRDPDEDPLHEVNIAYAFEIGKYEVTFAQYDAFAHATNRKLPDDGGWGRGSRPVIAVNFNDVQAYAKWLSQQTGKKYRLPTEAEWEYAARAGTQTRYWWGDEMSHNNAVCRNCGSQWDGKQTASIGLFKANAFGLYDTAGNISEWVEDCWHENYHNAPVDGSAWLEGDGGDCSIRVVRGGSWFYESHLLRSANRDWYFAVNASGNVGFRVVRDL